MDGQGAPRPSGLTVDDAPDPVVEILVTTAIVPAKASWLRKLWWSAWAIVVEYLPLTDDVLGSVEETTITVRHVGTGQVRTEAYERLSPADRAEAIAHLERRLNRGKPEDVERFFAGDGRFVDWT